MNQKYLEDYRLHTAVTESGRIEDTAEYIGPRFQYTMGSPRRKHMQNACAGLTVGQILLVLLPMMQTNTLSGIPYAILPHALLLVPVWILVKGLYTALHPRDFYTRQEADRISNSCRTCPKVLAVLSAIAMVGCAVWIIVFADSTAKKTDWLFLMCDVAVFVDNLMLIWFCCCFDMSVTSIDSAQ